jgi:signal transduction histidine kinase
MDTEPVMSRWYSWPLRSGVYALVGVLTFVTQPPGATALRAQLAGYLVAGAGLVAWALIDLRWPSDMRALTIVLTVVSMAGGFAGSAGRHENNCPITFTGIAAIGAGYSLSSRRAWAIVGAGILAFEANVFIYGDGLGQLSTFLLQPLPPMGGLVLGMLIRARQVQREQSEALLAEQHRADVLGERARIAREIHDVLAHSLGALGIQIQTARAVLTDTRDVGKAVEILLTAQKMAADGLHETRQAVHALRADVRPLDAALGRVADTHSEQYRVGVTFDVRGVPRPLPPEATVALLRTAQEALVNAAKHAAGQDVTVRLEYGDRDVRLTVVNALASPMPRSPDGGYGVQGMRERLRLLDGTLVAGPRDGAWSVAASVAV